MPDFKGWKPSAFTVAVLIVAASGLSGLTCWLVGINPLPTTGHWSKDPGWFLTFALVYFFVLYLVIERARPGRKRKLRE